MAHSWAHLHVGAETLGVLRGHAGDSGCEQLVHTRAKLDRGAVRADADRAAGLDAEPRRVLGRELDFRSGALELELGHAFHGRYVTSRRPLPVRSRFARAGACGTSTSEARSGSAARSPIPV